MSHDHAHQHQTEIMNYNRAFSFGIALNIIFVILEISFGFYADSLALIADAGHNLSDVFTLLLAWGAYYLSQKAATQTRTYGLKKVTILASLISTMLLISALGAIFFEAIERLKNPESVDGLIIIVVAGIGVFINAATAYLFLQGQKEDLNIKAAYMHMVADTAVSAGVVIAGLLIIFTGWLWIDPLLSMILVVLIFVGTWSLLKDSVNLSIDAVPQNIDTEEVKAYLLSLENIISIHDLHIWPLSTTQTAMSAHLITESITINNAQLNEIHKVLKERFAIQHATIQMEYNEEGHHCMVADEV